MHDARQPGVMIRFREKRNRRPRRGTRRGAPRDRRDEPLRVFVRTLARQAAREAFARELAMQRPNLGQSARCFDRGPTAYLPRVRRAPGLDGFPGVHRSRDLWRHAAAVTRFASFSKKHSGKSATSVPHECPTDAPKRARDARNSRSISEFRRTVQGKPTHGKSAGDPWLFGRSQPCNLLNLKDLCGTKPNMAFPNTDQPAPVSSSSCRSSR